MNCYATESVYMFTFLSGTTEPIQSIYRKSALASGSDLKLVKRLTWGRNSHIFCCTPYDVLICVLSISGHKGTCVFSLPMQPQK